MAEDNQTIQKQDPRKTLIEEYKKRIAENRLENERYKWELVSEFRGRPDVNASDFHQEVKSIKYVNLVYAMGIAVINHLAKDRPEEQSRNPRRNIRKSD